MYICEYIHIIIILIKYKILSLEGGLVGVKGEKGRVGNDVSLVLMYDVLHKILSILKVKNKKYWTMNISIKNIKTETGERTQLLRRLATLPEHLGHFLTTHIVANNCEFGSQSFHRLFCWYTDIHAS